jgi:hypothetical protein
MARMAKLEFSILPWRRAKSAATGTRRVQGEARLVDVERRPQDMNADLKPAVVRPAPREVEAVLEIACLVQPLGQLLLQPRQRRDRLEEIHRQHGV